MTGAEEEHSYDALEEAVGNTGNSVIGAEIIWFFDTYTVSRVPMCYTGDAFPFEVPQCKLYNGETLVASRAHGLADLFLHNDVLNQAISGFPTHGSMPATIVAPPTESTWTGTVYSLNP